MNTATSKLSVSSDNYYTVTLAPNWILLKWQSSVKKATAQPLSLIGHMETFWMWIVNYGELWNEDRQFYGTVYVISWTVNTALSTKGAKLWICDVFVSFQDFVGKTRNFSAWMLARFGRG